MKIRTRVKGIIVLIIFICTAGVTGAIIHEYQLEKSLDALKIIDEVRTIPLASVDKPVEVKRVEVAIVKPTVKKSLTVPAADLFTAHEEIPLAAEIQEHIENECERLEVDPAYIYALIESESSFRTGLCVEDGGGHSAGLCQINSVNWPDMEKRGLDPMNELDNITYCKTLVRGYLDKYPTIDHVTTCYKAGEGGAKRLNYHLSVCEEINTRTEYFNEILKGGK